MSTEEVRAPSKNAPETGAGPVERVPKRCDAAPTRDVSRAWTEEAQRRAEALAVGTLSSRPAEDVFRDAQSRL
ncbi:MAG: addiction module protein [Acidobacteria bacterium]|nr:addiction module protein [Acidobacteriota bacterium]